MCEDSQLLAFACLGEQGYPREKNDDAVHFNLSKIGYPESSKKLKRLILDHVDISGIRVNPPPQDPVKCFQDPMYKTL